VLIGAIVAEWALVEASLATTYSMLGCGPQPSSGATTMHWIAMETFESVSTFPQKCTIILGAAERRGFSNKVVGRFKKLLNDAQELAKGRAEAAHGRWAISNDFPQSLIFFRNAGKHGSAQVYDIVDFQKILDDISGVGVRLEALYNESLLPKLQLDAD
jgi:hypothetical protein